MSEPLRIARVLSRLNLGGPARQVLASDPLLAARGFSVRVFCGAPEPGEGDLFDAARERGIDVVRVPGMGRSIAPAADFRARRFLRRELGRWDPQLVHTHSSKAGALARPIALKLGVPKVHTFHGHVLDGYFPASVSKTLALLERRLAAKTERVVAVSHATAEDLVRHGVTEEERLVVIPPGLDLAPFLELPRGSETATRADPLRSLIGAAPDDFVVGVVGRLADVKRPELAVDVFELLAERYPGLHVVFVGDGSGRRALETRLGELDRARGERVHMLGARTDMPAVLAELDAVLLCSRSEGLPVALIEAAAAGLPVVATRVGGVEELVAEERTGYLGESADELAYGLAQLLEAPAEARAMGARARLRVEARHGARALADRLERLYRAVLEEHACAS